MQRTTFPHRFNRLSLVLLLSWVGAAACNDSSSKTSDAGKSDAAEPDASPATGATCKMDSDCDDGLYCTGTETCAAGHCQAGTAVTCDDGLACTVDSCSERTHKCTSSAPDRDGDGHGDARCKDKDGKTQGDDCDDSDPLRFPGNIEVCDPGNKDDDCDPKTFGEKDSDDDGFFDAKCCNAASDAKGAKLTCGTDCDDQKPSVNPKATEVCDRFDNDCDGKLDEGVSVKQYADADFDGHGAKGSKAVMKCAGSVGFASAANDCNDHDPEIFVGQFEICDGKDNNCDGDVDEIHQDAPWFTDVDQDGFGDATSTPVYSCERIPGRVLSHNDCDDTKPAINPAAAELCDGVDNDCNGKRDFALAALNDFEDDDNDGVADANCKPAGKDCDDTDPSTAGGMEEVCDMHDNDCDDVVDEDTSATVWYLDNDGDGWGTDHGTALARCEPIPGRAANRGDCDDDVNSTHPGALETCNGTDDNCNAKTDEGTDYQCAAANAVSFCKLGACAVLSCLPGFDDCNHDAADGCECKVTQVSLGACPSGLDADCQDGNYCNGKEHCVNQQCFGGTPINCSVSDSVLQGSFAIQSSLDIQMLGGIETITGDLSINNTTLNNLIGMEALKTIGGNLFVQNNAELQALVGSGLINLINVGGDINISNNSALTVIRLPSLVTAGSITIRYNDSLVTLDGFDSLVKVDGIVDITGNLALEKLTAFKALTDVGHLKLIGNFLSTVTFTAIDAIHGDLDMDASTEEDIDDTLTKVSFPKLTKIEGSFRVGYSTELTTISFPVLKAVTGYEFRITSCDVLNTPDLHSLTTFGHATDPQFQQPSNFTINNNAALTNLSKLPALDCPTMNCTADISNNNTLDNCDAQQLLTSFTNFTTLTWSYNGSTLGDAGLTCPNGSIGINP